jgi:hypothetical protein
MRPLVLYVPSVIAEFSFNDESSGPAVAVAMGQAKGTFEPGCFGEALSSSVLDLATALSSLLSSFHVEFQLRSIGKYFLFL